MQTTSKAINLGTMSFSSCSIKKGRPNIKAVVRKQIDLRHLKQHFALHFNILSETSKITLVCKRIRGYGRTEHFNY